MSYAAHLPLPGETRERRPKLQLVYSACNVASALTLGGSFYHFVTAPRSEMSGVKSQQKLASHFAGLSPTPVAAPVAVPGHSSTVTMMSQSAALGGAAALTLAAATGGRWMLGRRADNTKKRRCLSPRRRATAVVSVTMTPTGWQARRWLGGAPGHGPQNGPLEAAADAAHFAVSQLESVQDQMQASNPMAHFMRAAQEAAAAMPKVGEAASRVAKEAAEKLPVMLHQAQIAAQVAWQDPVAVKARQMAMKSFQEAAAAFPGHVANALEHTVEAGQALPGHFKAGMEASAEAADIVAEKIKDIHMSMDFLSQHAQVAASSAQGAALRVASPLPARAVADSQMVMDHLTRTINGIIDLQELMAQNAGSAVVGARRTASSISDIQLQAQEIAAEAQEIAAEAAANFSVQFSIDGTVKIIEGTREVIIALPGFAEDLVNATLDAIRYPDQAMANAKEMAEEMRGLVFDFSARARQQVPFGVKDWKQNDRSRDLKSGPVGKATPAVLDYHVPLPGKGVPALLKASKSKG